MDDTTSSKRLSVPTNPARALRDLNRQPAPTPKAIEDDGEEHESENYTTILQSDKPTDTPTHQQTDRPTNSQTSQQSNLPTDRQTNKQPDKPTSRPANKPKSKPVVVVAKPPDEADRSEEPARVARIDGRTLRARQPTADRTMVTSLRLAVETVEALDDYCWRHRQRKQDVVQAALDLYFAAEAEEGA